MHFRLKYNRKYTCLQEIVLYEFGGVYGARAFSAGGLVKLFETEKIGRFNCHAVIKQLKHCRNRINLR